MKNHKFILFIILLIVSCGQIGKNDSEKKSKSEVKQFIKNNKMDKTEFWKIIEYSIAKSNDDKLEQEKVIIEKLSTYNPEQIIEFEIIFRQLVIQADDFKIMAAQKIIEGYVSDDSYLYFRCWLIGKGEKNYTETLKNPDFLSENINQDEESDFEELMYVATNAYKIRIGKEEEDESFPRDVAIGKGLDYDFGAPPTKGVDWKEEELPATYPKLWNLYN
ncbi:DUF4240 domain-containing protein [Flavobacterium sp. ANB]|uniref:DUF4240 domain-containing protein n=1 Tax=unclassified Flavobacterium TaxID=196869 RepID=UPI0012B996DB|nr:MULTISPECIES: DUF4240 domain-containing protein [unclassified Flavobacterium]MBF4517764.1 DUF4240 domain-containing protein [Flavobacterium sp. ANB]MTD70491.1 DUF4240 domain-containing protein [Flavobacterium sp. LC2016-13]